MAELPAQNADRYLETQEKQEHKEKKQTSFSKDKLEQKVKKIQEKLDKKFPNGGKEFFIRNMNDYLQAKYGAHFELQENNGKNELVLRVGDSKKKEELIKKLIVEENQIYVDENQDGKRESSEKWVKFTENGMEADNIFVSKKEIKQSQKELSYWKINNKEWEITSKESKWWKVILIDGKDYYQVWNYKDYLAAPIRLFNSLSNEYFDWMSAKELSKKIPLLWVKKWKNGYEFAKLTSETKKEWYKKVGDFNSEIWKKIVKPWSKIDLTSLADALDVKKQETKKESKEKLNSFSWWGIFYFGSKWETWDLPDDWKNITYKWYNKTINNLNGKQISINAENLYDKNTKNNKFSFKKEIDLWSWKKWFLLVWEWLKDTSKIENEKDPSKIQEKMKWSKTEAWFVTYEKWKVLIQEVWDKKFSTITETSKPIERWKTSESPIYLYDNNYKFNWDVSWNIKFDVWEKLKDSKDKKDKKLDIKLSWNIKLSNWKTLQLENFKWKDNQKEFEKIFPGWKWYLQLNNKHVVELSYDAKKWIQVKDLWIKKLWLDVSFWWVNIHQEGVSDLEYNKDTKELKFPKKIWWGEIKCKIDKKNIILENKIWDTNVEITWLKKEELNPVEIFQGITKSLLYLGTEKINDNKYPEWVNYDKKAKKINIDISKIKEDEKMLLSKLNTGWKISETFIMDSIKENVAKNYAVNSNEKQDINKNNKANVNLTKK